MPDATLWQLRLARLRSQHLTDDSRLDSDVATVVRAVCALQAQAFDAARQQVRVRSAGVTAAAVDRAFEQERSVVRTWLMRGTLHLCAADDLRWLIDVFGPAVNQFGASRRRNLGLDDATCAAVSR
jgi:Winged helix DNA-binding domain